MTDRRVVGQRVGPQHAGALLGEQLRRAVAVDDREHRALACPAARRQPAGATGQHRYLDTPRIADRQARFDRRAGVVGVDVHRVTADDAGRRDGHRLTELVQPLAQCFGSLGVAPAQQIHHLELRRWRLGGRLGAPGGAVPARTPGDSAPAR